MSGNVGLRSPACTILIAMLAWSFNCDTCFAREGKLWLALSEHKEYSPGGSYHAGGRVSRLMIESHAAQVEPATTTPLQNVGSSAIFNVLDYGAKGDGNTDDTKAFEAAWADACKVGASTMVVPSGSVFLVKPISFSGTGCESNIVFQLDGKIIAPTSSEAWGSGLLQWLEFTKLKGITIRGKGIIDGQGSVWWNESPTDNPTNELDSVESSAKESNYISSQDLTSSKAIGKMPSTKPTALKFYGSSGVTVTGIQIQNSPQAHLKFDACTSVQVFDMTVSSPGNSPNTDGIHLQNSQDVVIHSTNLACGIILKNPRK